MLSVRKRSERAIQDIHGNQQQREFPLDLPKGVALVNAPDDLDRVESSLPGLEREIVETDFCSYLPVIFVFAQQQVEEGRLPPAVSSYKAKLPVGVDLEIDVFKKVAAAFIGKGQVPYVDQGHPLSSRKTDGTGWSGTTANTWIDF